MSELNILHGSPSDYRAYTIVVLGQGNFTAAGTDVTSATLSFGDIELVIAGSGLSVGGNRTISGGSVSSVTLRYQGTTIAVLDNLPAGTTGDFVQSAMNAPPPSPSWINQLYASEAALIVGSPQSDFLHGTAFNDTIDGGNGYDLIFAGDGDDTIYLADTVDMRGDFVRPGRGNNTIIASPVFDAQGKRGGNEFGFNDLTSKVTVDLKAGTASGAGMFTTFSEVHYVAGTNAKDTLKGGVSAFEWEAFVGNGGNDVIDGRGGFDWVFYDDEVDYGAAKGSGWVWGTKGVIVDLAQKTARDSFGSTDSLKNIEGVAGTKYADQLIGDGKANHLRGNAGKDSIAGGEGADTIVGGAGKDKLEGGSGADNFVFAEFGKANTDTISDFKSGTDSIVLPEDVFLDIGGKLNKGEFLARSSGNAAKDTNDRIIYDKSTGTLWYDRDGTGTDHNPVKFAVLADAPTLKFSDFDMV